MRDYNRRILVIFYAKIFAGLTGLENENIQSCILDQQLV